MPTLLWFRRDLRLRDLPPLLRAAAESDGVLACFVLDPRLEASSGSRRMQFLCDSLRQLRDDLDGRLLVTRGRPDERIPVPVKEIDAPSVHVSEDFAPYGRQRDDRVRSALGDVPLVATGSPYLVSPARVTKDDGEPYKVFTSFFGRWHDMGWRSAARSGAKSANWVDPTKLGQRAKPVEIPDPGVELDLPAGEAAARRQWKKFVDKGLENYGDDRNRPDHNGTSRMSTQLKFGTIHPRTMVADLTSGAPARERICESWLFVTSTRRYCIIGPTASGGIGTAISTPSKPIPARRPSDTSNPGKPARQDFRSSTPACVSFVKPVSCTTECG